MVQAVNGKQHKFLGEEDELKKFPLTLKQFAEPGGVIWTARELDDGQLQKSFCQKLCFEFKK